MGLKKKDLNGQFIQSYCLDNGSYIIKPIYLKIAFTSFAIGLGLGFHFGSLAAAANVVALETAKRLAEQSVSSPQCLEKVVTVFKEVPVEVEKVIDSSQCFETIAEVVKEVSVDRVVVVDRVVEKIVEIGSSEIVDGYTVISEKFFEELLKTLNRLNSRICLKVPFWGN